MKIGIEAISFDVPKIFLDIKDLAALRGIEAAKLELGLGLKKMALPDVHQDVVVFAANAVRKLIIQENLRAEEIDRIYLGTESSFDSSKPMASYLHSVLENSIFQPGDLSNCDVVDLTFACIGGVDALQNSLDYVKANPGKKAIVVCSDIAKYDLDSSGEYTQGAGALAMLVSENPKIISFDQDWAVSTEGVFDFFKPKRTVKKETLGIQNNEAWQGVLETEISIFKDQPVFDGQYSNTCYLERTSDAYFKLKKMKSLNEGFFNDCGAVVMHLPYCFQARRNFVEIFVEDSPLKTLRDQSESPTDFVKSISKSEEYKRFVKSKIYPSEIASAEIGNLYTGSIFMGFLSMLSYFAIAGNEIESQQILFIAYGSGSKSKCFSGHLANSWKEKIVEVGLFQTLEERTAITADNYLKLHKKELSESLLAANDEFVLDHIETELPNLLGARSYKFV